MHSLIETFYRYEMKVQTLSFEKAYSSMLSKAAKVSKVPSTRKITTVHHENANLGREARMTLRKHPRVKCALMSEKWRKKLGLDDHDNDEGNHDDNDALDDVMVSTLDNKVFDSFPGITNESAGLFRFIVSLSRYSSYE